MKIAQTSILKQIRSALNERIYSGDYRLEYDADEFERCLNILEGVGGPRGIDKLVDDADLVWSYIASTVEGWLPRPSSKMLEYNSPRYNARELFCITVLDLARNTMLCLQRREKCTHTS